MDHLTDLLRVHQTILHRLRHLEHRVGEVFVTVCVLGIQPLVTLDTFLGSCPGFLLTSIDDRYLAKRIDFGRNRPTRRFRAYLILRTVVVHLGGIDIPAVQQIAVTVFHVITDRKGLEVAVDIEQRTQLVALGACQDDNPQFGFAFVLVVGIQLGALGLRTCQTLELTGSRVIMQLLE